MIIDPLIPKEHKESRLQQSRREARREIEDIKDDLFNAKANSDDNKQETESAISRLKKSMQKESTLSDTTDEFQRNQLIKLGFIKDEPADIEEPEAEELDDFTKAAIANAEVNFLADVRQDIVNRGDIEELQAFDRAHTPVIEDPPAIDAPSIVLPVSIPAEATVIAEGSTDGSSIAVMQEALNRLSMELISTNDRLEAVTSVMQSKIDDLEDESDDITIDHPIEPPPDNPTAFYPTWSITASHAEGAVDIAEGAWYMNNTKVADSAGTDNIGDVDNPFIVATITVGTAKPLIPATITIAAQAALATPAESATKRNICQILFDANDKNIGINRFQIGDIYQNSGAINTNTVASPTYTDGGTSGVSRDVMTSIQWNSSVGKLQAKFTTMYIISGSWYMDAEDTDWTDILTASACP